MRIDDKLEIKVVVGILDKNDVVVEILNDWRDIVEVYHKHRFGFVIADSATGLTLPDYADFYETISDAMNDYRRSMLIRELVEESKKGYSITALSERFKLSEANVAKILTEYVN